MGRSSAAVGCGCTTSPATRRVRFRTVPAFRVPPTGSSSYRNAADPAERRQRRVPGRDVGELRRDAAAEVQRGGALRPARTIAGAGQQPPNPDRHRAEQRAEGRPVVALAGQRSVASRASAAPLARGGHLRRHDLRLQRRGEPLRLLQPEPELGEAGLLFAFDPGDLGLGRHVGCGTVR